MSDNAILARLQAKEEIRDLVASYCHAIAAADLDSLMQLFAEQAYINVNVDDGKGSFGKVEGREAMRAFYKDMVALAPKPFIHNHLIDIDGDRATGRCSVEIRGLPDALSSKNGGYYEDRYLHDGESWKFETRSYFPY
ncbi:MULTISPECIES: nuclear transport factor 2 family protein [Spongiibacter]|uniref:nuclear transport factor 2 family protein n=1 Tax=Spongiibacter TaxID=630749 RepID=UPI002580650D|nr:nuclear transport factor 2 family protein [Spongiibacter sp. UBA1325]|tara:strand:+ start:4656 stop:5069 length:414 start_codon:yes stop_codon:yes gene_type:complete